MAVGIAVLVSMMFAPHRGAWGFLGQMFYVKLAYNPYVPDWCRLWYWFPVFWIEPGNPILWSNFAGQTAFLAVLAAVAVNIRKPKQQIS
jgi:hypothetical protein